MSLFKNIFVRTSHTFYPKKLKNYTIRKYNNNSYPRGSQISYVALGFSLGIFFASATNYHFSR